MCRRALLASLIVPVLPAAKLPQRCCDTAVVPPQGVAFRDGAIVIDLNAVKELRQTGAAWKIVDEERKINIIVAHPGKGRYVALDRVCTHGGGSVAYNRDKKTVQCTCWGQSEFDFAGEVVFGPAKRPLRTYSLRLEGSTLTIALEKQA
jgi:Rieske Fe-S protein